jgi:hypothetical protein
VVEGPQVKKYLHVHGSKKLLDYETFLFLGRIRFGLARLGGDIFVVFPLGLWSHRSERGRGREKGEGGYSKIWPQEPGGR